MHLKKVETIQLIILFSNFKVGFLLFSRFTVVVIFVIDDFNYILNKYSNKGLNTLNRLNRVGFLSILCYNK